MFLIDCWTLHDRKMKWSEPSSLRSWAGFTKCSVLSSSFVECPQSFCWLFWHFMHAGYVLVIRSFWHTMANSFERRNGFLHVRKMFCVRRHTGLWLIPLIIDRVSSEGLMGSGVSTDVNSRGKIPSNGCLGGSWRRTPSTRTRAQRFDH